MRYFYTIDGVAGSSSPVAQFSGRYWDGVSTFVAFSDQVAISIDDTTVDIHKSVIDWIATTYSAARKDVVFVG